LHLQLATVYIQYDGYPSLALAYKILLIMVMIRGVSSPCSALYSQICFRLPEHTWEA